MTIEYNGRKISYNKAIVAKQTLVDVAFHQLRATVLKLMPCPNGNHNQDKVIIDTNFGEQEVTGPDINNAYVCKSNGVSWKP